MAERRYGRQDFSSALYKLATRLVDVLADHLPTIALVLLSILLHALVPHVRTNSAYFDSTVEYSVYVIFLLGILRIVKWTLIDLLSKER